LIDTTSDGESSRHRGHLIDLNGRKFGIIATFQRYIRWVCVEKYPLV